MEFRDQPNTSWEKQQDTDLREQLTLAIEECYSTEGSACKLHPIFQPQKFLNLLPGLLERAGWHHCPRVEWLVLTAGRIGYLAYANRHAEHPLPYDQLITEAQLNADQSHCPVQQEVE